MGLVSGTRLGPYAIIAPLGSGGMGEVYKARDTRLERDVSLKLLPLAAMGDAVARAALIEEAKHASGLNHPHICTIHDIGEADGRTYFAMEYVEGQPLSQQIPHDGLPLELVLRYGGQIADALAYAHEHGIVHRDLKSANVMVTPDGRAKVLDFGLARRLADSALSDATLSKKALADDDVISGTLQYMAPETLRGERPDARVDIWALGVVLYEMSAGRLPFSGKTAYELTSTILREAPPPLPPRVPSGLRSVIQRSLAKEPGQRYSRIGEVRSALEAIRSSETLMSATPPTKEAFPRRFFARALAVSGSVLALTVLALLLRGWLISSNRGAPKQDVIANLAGPRTSSGGKASTNREANEYFERGLLYSEAELDLPKAQQMFEHALAIDPKFTLARGWHGANSMAMIDAGYSNDSTWLYKGEAELHQALEEDPSLGQAYCGLAGVYFYQGRKELMPDAIGKCLKTAPDLRQGKAWLGTYHVSNGNNAAAKVLCQQLVDKDPLYPGGRSCLADLFRTEEDLPAARREAEMLVEENSDDGIARVLLSRIYSDGGEYQKAQSVLRTIRRPEAPQFPVRLAWARLYAAEGKRAEALREMDEDLLKFLEVHKGVTVEAAEIYSSVGQINKALEWLERAANGGDERVEWFRRDPMFKNIRNQPRFQQILASVAARRQQRSVMQTTPE